MAMILSPVGGHDVADFDQAVRITEQQAQEMKIRVALQQRRRVPARFKRINSGRAKRRKVRQNLKNNISIDNRIQSRLLW
jgi:hypothetical protein